MAERSIAEIIGKGSQRWLIGQDGRRKPNGWHCPEPVTVDDMLAWLRKQGVEVIHPQDGALTKVPVVLLVKWHNGDGIWPLVKGDTLHAAVEAAVRQVAEQEAP